MGERGGRGRTELWSEAGEGWRRKMRQPYGEYSERVLKDEAERAFWENYLKARPVYAPDPYSLKVAEAAEVLLLKAGVESLLELGPGWGNYTLRLAALCRQLICVDSSPAVEAYIRSLADEHKLTHIITLLGRWEECAPPRCDGVFAYNCFYRMTEIESCLKKLHESAKTICVIGMNSSPEQPYFQELEQDLGLKVRYNRTDSRDLKGVLRSLGISPDIEISLPNQRDDSYDTFDEVVAKALARIIGSYDEQAVREVLHRHYVYKDGKYRCRHTFSSDLLGWYK